MRLAGIRGFRPSIHRTDTVPAVFRRLHIDREARSRMAPQSIRRRVRGRRRSARHQGEVGEDGAPSPPPLRSRTQLHHPEDRVDSRTCHVSEARLFDKHEHCIHAA